MSRLRPKQPRMRLEVVPYKQLRMRVLRRDGWRCQDCGVTTNLQVHHKQTRGRLGHDCAENLITLCVGCHERQHKRNSNHFLAEQET
jgi:5-methylcytosine-specific restriction endonuclease McrA